jgi:hypothetical protein
MDADRIAVEDLDTLDGVHRAALPVAADGGVFDAHDVELHRFTVDFAAVVEQHALAQPEGPGGELLVGLPALGDAGDDGASLIDVSQAGIHQGGWIGDVVLIMRMRVEAGHIAA